MTEFLTDNLNPHDPDNDDALAFLDRPETPESFTTPELERIDRELAERDENAGEPGTFD